MSNTYGVQTLKHKPINIKIDRLGRRLPRTDRLHDRFELWLNNTTMCVIRMIRYLTVSNGSCISRKRRQLPKQYIKPLQDVFIGSKHSKPFRNLNNQLTLNHIHKNTSLRYFNKSSYVNLSIYGQMSQITHTKKIWTFRLPSLDSKLEYDFLSTSVTRTAIRFYFKSAIWSFIGSFLIERVLMWIPYSFILHPEQVEWQRAE